MEWLNVSNLINCVFVMVAWGVKNELRHIGESIDNVKILANDAKNTALKAHDRIDFLIENRRQ